VSAVALPQGSSDRLLDELVAYYPYGPSYTMTSTPDGNYLYVGEGCSIAVILADPSASNPDDNYKDPIKRSPIGSTGVLPVKLLLDPDASTTPAFGAHDLLYIAGGRDGLWAMQADTQTETQPNRAVRIDDATVENSTSDQDSRRWCDDLDYITLGENGEQVTYLVALFGQKDGSRLRLYNLDVVRSAVNQALIAGLDLGFEINPDKSIGIGRHTSFFAAGYAPSFAFGMAVDDVNDHVYVAMGFHGLVRVSLDWPNNPPVQPWSLTWGPFFGDGSKYTSDVDSDLYKDVKFYEGAELVADYPPPFLDVAVDRTDPQDPWLYAAVDHLGLVGFSLSGTWKEFIYDGPSVKRFHQEGVKDWDHNNNTLFWSELVVDADPNVCSTFARRVQVVESAKALLVSTIPSSAMVHPAVLAPSRTFSYDHTMLGLLPLNASWTEFIPPALGGWIRHGYTLAYDLASRGSWVSGQTNIAAQAEMGRQMYGPPIQPSGTLSFFSGGDFEVSRMLEPNPAVSYNQPDLYRVEFSNSASGQPWPPQTPPLTTYAELVRLMEDRPGRWVYRAALNAANPQVLATTNNESGWTGDGPLVLDLTQSDGARIVANFDPGSTDDEGRKAGMNGILFEPDAACRRTARPGWNEYRFGFRRVSGGIRWRLAKMFGGLNVTNPGTSDPPHEEKAIFFTAPEDQFLYTGYYQYSGAGYCPEYCQDVSRNLVFASVFETPQGIRVLDLDELIADIDDDGLTTHRQNYNLGYSLTDARMVGELVTHPEFWNVPECRFGAAHDPDAEHFIDGGSNGPTEFFGRVRTMPPQFIKLPSAGGGHPADTWVLVVPCCYAGCDENAQIFSTHGGWKPEDDFRTGHGYSRLMVRFFNISVPGVINDYADEDHTGSRNVRAYTLLGPDERSSAMFLRTLRLDLEGDDDRYFCFVADLGGHMYVYEITDLLLYPPDFPHDDPPTGGIKSHLHYGATIGPDTSYPNTLLPFATYEPPSCVADDQVSNIFDVEVDSAHWIDGGVTHDEVYVYVSVQREGVHVLRLDLNGGSLVPVEMIQTPGETSFLYLCDVPEELEAVDTQFEHDYVREKLLFVGDAIAGFRIYTYSPPQAE